MRRLMLAVALVAATGCQNARLAQIASDGSATFAPATGSDTPIVHAPASPLSNVRVVLGGEGVLDAATDRGGGIWAVTAAKIYYFAPGTTSPRSYDQADGLARGWRTWQDTYYSGTATAPATFPVTFSAIAGAEAGEAIVGNVGAIADRVRVDPASGAILGVDNMKVTTAQSGSGEELSEHLKRVVATHTIAVDLDGTYHGTAYVGGWHGFEAFHGLDGDCGCLAFEEHRHFIPGADLNWCDSAGESDGCWGGDVRGLAITEDGDVWAGDRHFLQRLPQRSRGPHTGLFDDGVDFTAAIDVFPLVRDEIHGLAGDGGGVWAASEGNGLAYVEPNGKPIYWSRDHRLPMNTLHGVVVDGGGAVWIATAAAGLARFDPASSAWSYYTSASGLPSDDVNALYVDLFDGRRTLFVATANGLAIFAAP